MQFTFSLNNNNKDDDNDDITHSKEKKKIAIVFLTMLQKCKAKENKGIVENVFGQHGERKFRN